MACHSARTGLAIPPGVAVAIVCGAAAGLHAAHEQRGRDGRPLEIVHRDVSPSNVMVAYDGTIKVVDFGVAKAADRMTETRSGTVKGKIAYLSPEQALLRDLDRTSDVFSLGIVAWELATQRRLFKRPSDYETMRAIIDEPIMLGLQGKKPQSPDGKSIEPMENHGVQAMSIGFLIDAEQAVAWRGPMATGALEQLLRDTRWKDLDYLIVDMPPGTGDIQLTLAQKVPVTGAVIVTTPQDIALLDARKGLKMFEKVSVPILGIVENMGMHVCTNCGHEEHVFGAGGGEKMAADYGVALLGSLPLDIRIREHADAGTPTVVADPESRPSQIYRDIARRVAVKVADLAKDASTVFPKIVIQKT